MMRGAAHRTHHAACAHSYNTTQTYAHGYYITHYRTLSLGSVAHSDSHSNGTRTTATAAATATASATTSAGTQFRLRTASTWRAAHTIRDIKRIREGLTRSTPDLAAATLTLRSAFDDAVRRISQATARHALKQMSDLLSRETIEKYMYGAWRHAAARLAAANPFDSSDIPSLYYHPTPFHLSVLSRTPALTQPFRPTPWMRSQHAQTVLGTLLRWRPPIVYNREILSLKDGGAIALDWDSGETAGLQWSFRMDAIHATPTNPSDSTKPIVILFPGLTGGSNSKYLCQFIDLIRRETGWQCVVSNFRGIHCPMRTPKPSTGICVQDLIDTFHHLHACYPHAPKMAVGFSMGANMLVKALGQLGPHASEVGIVSSAAVSNAFDFVKLARALHSPLNELLYARFLTMQLKRNYIKQSAVQHVSRHLVKDLAHALEARNIIEFDDRFTKYLYNHTDVLTYYDDMSSIYHVRNVASPLFLLNALDDPFEGEIPFDAIRSNPSILLATTKRGGHVAWASGVNPMRYKSSWMLTTTLAYLQAACQVHREQKANTEINATERTKVHNQHSTI